MCCRSQPHPVSTELFASSSLDPKAPYCQRKNFSASRKLTVPHAASIASSGSSGTEPRALEHHAAQRVVQRRQRQRLHERLHRGREALGREEDPGEDPHRDHDEVHEARDALDRPRPRGGQQAQAAERERAEQRHGRSAATATAQRHAEHEVREQEQRASFGDQEDQARDQLRRQRWLRRTGAATSRFSRLPLRATTSEKPMPHMPVPIRFMPSSPGTRKST